MLLFGVWQTEAIQTDLLIHMGEKQRDDISILGLNYRE